MERLVHSQDEMPDSKVMEKGTQSRRRRVSGQKRQSLPKKKLDKGMKAVNVV